MRQLGITLLLVVTLLGCSAEAPVAKISFIEIKAAGMSHHLTFASDLPILELFSKNKHQRIVYSELVCSLDENHNLDIEHQLKFFIQGGIEFLKKTSDAGQTAYVYNSDVGFWSAPEDPLGSNRVLRADELHSLLGAKETIPCVVRMTINFSNPYYSDIFLIPSKEILRTMPKPKTNDVPSKS